MQILNRSKRQYRCIKTPYNWNGGSIFRIKGIYVIFDDEPNKMYYLTINGSIGKYYNIDDIPKPFSKYFKEII